MNKQDIVKKISLLLSVIEVHIHSLNKLNLTDFNIECEDIFCNLINKIHNLNLINLNYTKYNYPAIDLGDVSSGICYQITSSNDVSKINETIEKFESKNLDKIYYELNIFIIGAKKRYKATFPNYVNIIDISDLLNDISSIKNLQLLCEACDILISVTLKYGIILPDSDIIFNSNEALQIKYGSSYKKYLDFINNHENDKNYITDIIKFAISVSSFPFVVRKLLFYITLHTTPYKSHFTDFIYFDPNSITSLNFNNDPMIIDAFKFLINNGYAEHTEDEDFPHVFNLNFYNGDHEYCVLYQLVDFAKKNKLDISSIIINLNFSLLD